MATLHDSPSTLTFTSPTPVWRTNPANSMNRFSQAKIAVRNDKMKPLIELETVRQQLQEMRNAFQLFDRDGDGTINAKVAFISTLPRAEANNII